MPCNTSSTSARFAYGLKGSRAGPTHWATGDFISFQGLGIFSPQLWKCTGYVPKSLNFQCREFPCWDAEKENVDAQVERPGVEVVVGLMVGIVEEHGSRDKSHHRQEQGTKGEKHHHGHHHRQGRQRKDDREHGGKKRVKSSGEKDKYDKLKRKSSSQDAGHGPRVLFRSLPNNPKAMRNLATQNSWMMISNCDPRLKRMNFPAMVLSLFSVNDFWIVKCLI